MATILRFSRLIFTGILLLAAIPVVHAEWGVETHEPYVVLEKGLKVNFADLTKDELGLRCSVYLKSGAVFDRVRHYMMARSGFVNRDNRMIINGEFFELNHHGLQVGWFEDPKKKINSGEWVPLSEAQIDYIILEEAPSEVKDDSAALEKLRQIPPASAILDDSKMPPVLVVKAQGVFINNSKTPVPFDQVLRALANLPKEAWPFGRVIIYYPSPFGLSNVRDQPLPSDVRKVEAALVTAGIKLEYGQSE